MSLLAAQPILSEILLLAAQSSSIPLPSMFAPYFPVIGLIVACAFIELVFVWTDRTSRGNWWFTFSFVAIGVSLLIWNSWRESVDVIALVDSPDSAGTAFRLQLISYAVISLLTPVIMSVAAVKRCILECKFTGIGLMLLRLLPVTVVPVLLFIYCRDAFKLFEGIDFQMFY